MRLTRIVGSAIVSPRRRRGEKKTHSALFAVRMYAHGRRMYGRADVARRENHRRFTRERERTPFFIHLFSRHLTMRVHTCKGEKGEEIVL